MAQKKSQTPQPPVPGQENSLAGFAPATREWFDSAFAGPTDVQQAAWAVIKRGDNALVIAPTGSGKTLAAFLQAIDSLFHERALEAAGLSPAQKRRMETRVLYISPLKALGADVRKNLDVPLRGVSSARERRGDPAASITVGMRTGDTPSSERAGLIRRPPDILITTPESLYLMLTSKARETLRHVRTVIVDEVHAVAGTKRGAHLALSLERLDNLLESPAQRVGLSATVRPVDQVAAFLGGTRPVTVVNPPSSRRLEMRIVVPVEDMADLPAPVGGEQGASERQGRTGSIWFHVEASILDRILSYRSTIVFVNSRGLAERLTARLNELYAERLEPGNHAPNRPTLYDSCNGGTGGRSEGMPPLIARSHHGSVSKERRAEIERELKSGELRCVVATSSLELGIDMGQVDLVIQVAPPPSVASGLQRVGRAGHHVGGTPAGLVYPRTRRDLVDAAVTVENMLAGNIESISPPRNPLDILAQQIVAMVAMDPVDADALYLTVRRSDPFRSLSRAVFDATLDMLAGRFPSDEFAEFRPRLVWDRNTGILTSRPGSQRLAVVNGGTIPDRGLFTVVLPEGEEQAGSRRVGELDEEMVYESRVNDVITLGATSWRIRQITNDQVVVTPAPGRSARLPFWHGEGPGRPAELGQAIGAFLRAMDGDRSAPSAIARLEAAGLDRNAVTNLLNLVEQQRGETGDLPTDQTLVVERCRDEVGDWRLMLHSPYGKRVHSPWALAVSDRIRRRFNVDASVVASDDGIVARIPDTEGRLPGAELFAFEADSLQRLIIGAVGTSALFAARFRECAARALLLPRRTPGRRSPLWQQRLRAGQLLEVAREHPDFPILIETARECLQDVYDLPALHDLMVRLASGDVRIVDVTTETPSTFAANLLFGYVGEFMYEYDSPLAERRASLLALDSGLLSELLGQADLGELLDPKVIETVEAELQCLAADRRVSGFEGVADLLRRLGPLSVAEIAARLKPGPGDSDVGGSGEALADGHLEKLAAVGRAIPVRIAGEDRWAAVEDAARLRDALGTRLPGGIPTVFLQALDDPLRDLVSRFARTHAVFTSARLADRFGLGVAVVDGVLGQLHSQGRVLRGEFGFGRGGERNPDEDGHAVSSDNCGPQASVEWIWEDVFRRLRVRSLQAAREATRPVARTAYVLQLLERQHLVSDDEDTFDTDPDPAFVGALRGVDGVARVVEQLAGVALPASLWESHILSSRVRDYSPGMLDQLIASGEVLWSGSARLGDNDGMVSLHLQEFAAESLPYFPEAEVEDSLGDLQKTILDILSDGGAYFAQTIAQLAGSRHFAAASQPGIDPMAGMGDALWGLAWAGWITTDTWSTMRAFTGARSSRQSKRTRTVRRRVGGSYKTFSFTQKSGGQGFSAQIDPTIAGRWSLLPRGDVSETVRALTAAEGLLDRYGVVTRGAAVAEKIPGGYSALQRIFRGMEDAGRVLRGRFVEGLGAAQFADTMTINRLRELADDSQKASWTVALSAADPANPYGVVIPWPASVSGIKPNRRAGAMVVIRGGALLLWLAQGGGSLLTFAGTDEPDSSSMFDAACQALARRLGESGASTFTLQSIDDRPVGASPLAASLRAAGFSYSPRGLSWYAKVR